LKLTNVVRHIGGMDTDVPPMSRDEHEQRIYAAAMIYAAAIREIVTHRQAPDWAKQIGEDAHRRVAVVMATGIDPAARLALPAPELDAREFAEDDMVPAVAVKQVVVHLDPKQGRPKSSYTYDPPQQVTQLFEAKGPA
jgi:hypothetical protein